MSVTDNLVRRFLNQAQVLSKTAAANDVFHLIIQGQDLVDLNYIPGQHVRIFIGMGVNSSFGDKIRTYSVWHYDREQGILQLAVCAHTDGPGSHWIRSIVPGQPIYLSSPKGKFNRYFCLPLLFHWRCQCIGTFIRDQKKLTT